MDCEVLDLGLIEYERAWKLQDEYAREIAEGKRPPTLLLLEHPHVYTFGRRGKQENLLWGESQLKEKGIANGIVGPHVRTGVGNQTNRAAEVIPGL